MKRTILSLILLISFLGYGQNWENKLASEVNFISWIGNDESEITHYSLNGHHLMTPRAKGYKMFIRQWLNNHPNAKIIPVASALVGTRGEKRSIMLNCWIVDKNENLNLTLVEKGYFSLEGVIKFKTWNELTDLEKKENPEYENIEIDILINDSIYSNFIQNVKIAERNAKESKLGIWSNEQ